MAKELFYFLQHKGTKTYHIQSTAVGSNKSICGESGLKTVRCRLSGKKVVGEEANPVYRLINSSKNRRSKKEMLLLVAALQNDLTHIANFFEDDDSFDDVDSFEKDDTADDAEASANGKMAVSGGICGRCISSLYKED